MSDRWLLIWEGFDPEKEGLREALCTLGNGFFATRGAAEEHRADGTHYPGTYVAGGYNQLSSEVAGRVVVNEDLVNVPNWLPLTFCVADAPAQDLGAMEILAHRQELDLREGTLRRQLRVEDRQGRITSIESRRLVHMGKPNLAAIEWRVVAENWSGAVLLRSGLDGSVTNTGVARYRQLASKHLEVQHRGPVAPEGIYLKVRTTQSHIEVAEAARTGVFRGEAPVPCERRVEIEDERVAEELRVELHRGEELRVEKVVSLFTSRDRGISEAGVAARLAMETAPDFAALRDGHRAAWRRLWRRCDLEIDEEPGGAVAVDDQVILRLHIFHLLQTASPNTCGRDVGIPARGLHGEAYRGHIFWDEVFILPFYIQRLPALARTVTLYRYNRLEAARELAREAGGRGAAFPWQSGSDGREATQQLHLNPMSGRWDPDYSHLQRHVSAAIAYNLWRYWEATGDRAFLEDHGAELLLEIARFFASIATWNPRSERYDIAGVMGPDEYHEKHPGAESGGLRNNAYTNITAVWCLLRARDVLDAIDGGRRAELLEMLSIDDAELEEWDRISRRIAVPFHDGVISQFEGYEELEELDWEGYRSRYGRIERLDRVLKAEGRSPDELKVSKQADVAMLLYLFPVEELLALLGRLGYEVGPETIRRTVEHYEARTSHGSTLSKVVFASAAHRQDCHAGVEAFRAALRSDIDDVQGGTTAEGVHLGAMAGTVDIVMRHYAGLELGAKGARLSPDLPPRLRGLRFRFQYRARWYDVDMTRQRVRVAVDDIGPDVEIEIAGRRCDIPSGTAIEVELPEHRAS